MQNSKLNLVSNALKINLTLFGISIITQSIFLNFLYYKGHDLMFKDEIVSDKAFIVIGFNICLTGLLILYSFFIQNRALPHLLDRPISLLEKISISLSSFSIIAATCLISLCTLNNEFKDFINLPFGFKLHFNWPFSERFGYIKNILRESAVPEPADLELRARETTSMDSIRDLAASIEQSHIEKLRAAIESEAHALINNSPPGMLDDMNNWIHDNYVEITIGGAIICLFALSLSVFAYLSFSNKAAELDKALADLQLNMESIDGAMRDVTRKTGIMDESQIAKIKDDFDNLARDTDMRIANISDYNDEAITSSYNALASRILPRLQEVEKTTDGIKQIGKFSSHKSPHSSVSDAMQELAKTVFQNDSTVKRLWKGVKEADVSASFGKFTKEVNPRLDTVDAITRAFLESNDANGNPYTSVYKGIIDLSNMSNEHQSSIPKLHTAFMGNRESIKVLTERLDQLTEKVNSSAVPEQVAAVASAVSESVL